VTVGHSEGWGVFTGRATYQIIPSVILEKHVQNEWTELWPVDAHHVGSWKNVLFCFEVSLKCSEFEKYCDKSQKVQFSSLFVLYFPSHDTYRFKAALNCNVQTCIFCRG